MTKYKKLVKKRSLRYKNCKTHRRKGRKAGAGGTWRWWHLAPETRQFARDKEG